MYLSVLIIIYGEYDVLTALTRATVLKNNFIADIISEICTDVVYRNYRFVFRGIISTSSNAVRLKIMNCVRMNFFNFGTVLMIYILLLISMAMDLSVGFKRLPETAWQANFSLITRIKL